MATLINPNDDDDDNDDVCIHDATVSLLHCFLRIVVHYQHLSFQIPDTVRFNRNPADLSRAVVKPSTHLKIAVDLCRHAEASEHLFPAERQINRSLVDQCGDEKWRVLSRRSALKHSIDQTETQSVSRYTRPVNSAQCALTVFDCVCSLE